VVEVTIGQFDELAIAEEEAKARAAKEAADATRDYVLAKFQHLSGYKYPLEIYSIANVPSHNCLIMNDHFLLSYVEAEQILREILSDRTDT
jgi:hypothetical protein